MSAPGSRHGFTLIELMVVIAVMGIVLAVSSLSISSMPGGEELGAGPDGLLHRIRARAVQQGTPVVVTAIDSSDVGWPVLFLPDGRVLGLERVPNLAALESRP